MTKKFKRPIAFMLAVIMAMVINLPSGISGIFDFVKRVNAATITATQPTGDGSSSSPYKIGTAGELYWFANYVNSGNTSACAVLTANITVNTGVLSSSGSLNSGSFTAWTPISKSSYGYTGTFNGKGYTISGLYFNNTSTDYAGLFGYIKANGKVSNVGIIASYFNGSSCVGGISGENYGTITNCYNTGTVSGTSTIGGVCGGNYGTITSCYNTGKVNGTNYSTGGVCGRMYGSSRSVSKSYNTGAVSGVNWVGGIVGYANTSCNISSSYNIGNVSGTEAVGGLVGYLSASNTSTAAKISNCYSAASVSGKNYVGGVCGWNYYSSITDTYYNNAVYTGSSVGKNDSGTNSITGNSTDAFKSGEVCYKLNGSKSEGDLAWGQKIGRDTYPVLGGRTVYYMYNSITGKYVYTNECNNHNYSNGICSVCDDYEEPTQDANSVYQIANAGNLCWFADYVYSGNTTVNAVLIADIDFSSYTFTSIGTADNPFGGIFDGCGYTITVNQSGSSDVAIFGRIGNCTIKNITVTGTIYTNVKSAAGIAVQNVKGYTANIENCISDVTIVSSIDGDGTHGGIIGGVDGTVYINNCAFTGAITGSNTNCCGGLIGWTQGTSTMSNSYVSADFSGILSDSSNTFSRNPDKVTLKNCYYLNELNETPSGATQMTADQFKSGEVCYKLNGSTSEGNLAWGQKIGRDTYPVLGGETVYYKYNNITGEYVYTNGCITHNYSNGICSVCDNYEEPTQDANSVYQIANAGNLCWFTNYVNSGNTTANAVLIADIDLSSISSWTPIGNSDNGYAGTFDGNNYTIKNMSITKQGTNSGLFGYTSGATIKNIKITGNITLTTTSYTEAYGSIVGGASGTDITNCHSSVNITISKDSTIDSSRSSCIGHIGGIVGQVLDPVGTVSNCSYSGTIELNDRPVNVAAGIAAYSSYNASPTITNCSFTGAINSTNADAIILGGILGYINTVNNVNLANCLSVGTITKSGSTSTNGMIIGQINNGYGNNCVINNYYLSSSVSGVGSISGTPTTTPATACTQAELNSGKICYLLNGSTSEGNLAWGQQIGRDTYPVLGGKTVYYMYNNITGEYVYTNGCITHNYSNGICSVCDDYEEPTQDANSVYQIANAGNLCWFAYYVNRGNTTVNAVLIADIDFSSNTFTSIGTADNPFSGIFDGCGYTITVNQSGSSDVAIFGCIGNCTIKNLVVDGTINTGEKFAAGIAMQNLEGYTSNIENCISDVTIASSINGDGTHGGIIGVVDGTVNINNCAFIGAMTGSNTNSCGGIIGWTDETSTISNSYVAADFSISSTSCNTFSRYWKANSVTVTNCYYLNKINTAPSGATQMSADQFKSGEVCYKLNGGVTDGTQAWYQTLAEDTLPKLEGKTVFYNESVDPQYFDAVLGDVSGDDTTNKADAALVLKYAGDIGTLSAKQLTVADVNGDGTVNMLDVVNILNMIA